MQEATLLAGYRVGASPLDYFGAKGSVSDLDLAPYPLKRRMRFELELDPREAEDFVRPLPARQQLVYLLAVRGLCPRCRGDRQFRERTDALVTRFRRELVAVLKESAALERELVEAVAAR
jgi:hypothetical protein